MSERSNLGEATDYIEGQAPRDITAPQKIPIGPPATDEQALARWEELERARLKETEAPWVYDIVLDCRRAATQADVDRGQIAIKHLCILRDAMSDAFADIRKIPV